jgi:hypothetical protein
MAKARIPLMFIFNVQKSVEVKIYRLRLSVVDENFLKKMFSSIVDFIQSNQRESFLW